MKKKMKCFDDASGSFASLTCSLISIKFKYLVCWWWFYVNLWIKAFWEIIFALKCIQVCFLLTFKNINQERNFLVTRIRWHIGHLRLFLCWSKITFEFLSAVRKNLFFFASSSLIQVEYKVSLLSHITLNLNFYEPHVLNILFVISSLKCFLCFYEIFIPHVFFFGCASVKIEEKRGGKKLNFQFLSDDPH